MRGGAGGGRRPARRIPSTPVEGGYDVLAQHLLGMACAAPFDADDLYAEFRRAWPYRELGRRELRPRARFRRDRRLRAARLRAIRQAPADRRTARWRIAHPGIAQQYRLNVGTIVEDPMVKVRLVRARGNKAGQTTGPIGRGGRVLGEIEEYFIDQLVKGDTFVFGSEIVAYEGMVETEAYVSRSIAADPKIPSYMGGKFPLSTFLADGVRRLLSDPTTGRRCPSRCATGWRCSTRHRCCRPRRTCWSRRFRAARRTTSSATRSRAGWRTRRSACC